MNDYWDDGNKKDLSRNRKIAAGAVVFFGVMIIGLWFANLKATINGSLAVKGGSDNTSVATSTCTGPDCPENIAKLKTQDTDKDGLTDYDELYIYNTSPYLEDSDSDGYSDYEEIQTGKDPNCPAGQTCQAATAEAIVNTATGTTGMSGSTSGAATQSNSQLNLNSSDITEQSLQNIFNGQIDAATLRQMLLSSGMTADQLNKFSDDELMKAYNDTLNTQK
jgi:hypothetical protein